MTTGQEHLCCQEIMKILIVLAAAALVVGASEVTVGKPNDTEGKVVNNEILRTNRRIFNGGWGSSNGGHGLSASGFRPGPPPQLDGSLMSLLNAMSNFGLSSNYGPPGAGGGNGGPPSSQYGPPSGGGGSGGPPPSQYGAPNGGGKLAAGIRVQPGQKYGPPGGPNGISGLRTSQPNSLYGPPGHTSGKPLASTLTTAGKIKGGFGGVPGGVPGGRGAFGPNGAIGQDGGRIFRYVSLFTAPDDPPPPKPKIIRAGPATPDRHVNIIFVRPPTPAVEPPTEVILPASPERKTIVYVLMKKPVEGLETVKVRPAPPTTPSKPEVFFIPYTDPSGNGNGKPGDNQGGYEQPPSEEYGPPNAGAGVYGPPAPGLGGPNNGGYKDQGFNNGGVGSAPLNQFGPSDAFNPDAIEITNNNNGAVPTRDFNGGTRGFGNGFMVLGGGSGSD